MEIGGANSSPKQKDWTVLVYAGGVNNLDASIRKNWEAADDQPLPDNVDVFVRHFSQDGKSVDVHMNKADGTTVKENSAEPSDSSSPETLAQFFRLGVKTYPAKRYMVVVSSHGKGPEGVIEDDRARRLMSPAGFKSALDVAKEANQGVPVDVVLFDACRMAAMEMASQMMGSAGVAVASMDNIASVGYSLTEIIRSASQSQDAHALATRLVHNDEPQQVGSCLSLTAVDLNRLAPLHQALRNLTEELQTLPSESARSVRRISESTRRNSISPDSWQLVDMLADHILGSAVVEPSALESWLESVKPGQSVALVAFCQDLLANDSLQQKHPALKMKLRAVLEAHDQAVFASRAEGDVGGLTLSLPLDSSQGPLYPDGVEASHFERSTGWSRAVHVIVPPNEPAQRPKTWLEQELSQRKL